MSARSLADMPDVLTAEEVCEVLHLSRNTVYEQLRRGIIPSTRFGRQFRVSRVALASLLTGAPLAPIGAELAQETTPES